MPFTIHIFQADHDGDDDDHNEHDDDDDDDEYLIGLILKLKLTNITARFFVVQTFLADC